MQANILSVISDATLLAGFLAGAVTIGKKLGWYQRKITDMGKKMEGICRDVEELDQRRQASELENKSFTSKYGEKIDNIAGVLAEVKDMLFKHVMNGNKQ